MNGADSCLFRLYSAVPEGARVMFIGSSRVRRGIEPDVMTAALGLPPTGVVNYGHPTPSLPQDLSALRRLLTSDAPDVMVFGVIPRSQALRQAEREIDPRTSAPFDIELPGGKIKQTYLLSGRISDQVALLRERIDNPILLAWETTRLYGERIRRFIPAVLTEDILRRPLRGARRYEPDRQQDCRQKAWIDPSDEAQNGSPKAREQKEAYLARFATFTDPDPLGYFEDPTRQIEHASIRGLIKLAAERGATPAFFYIPGIGVPIDPGLSAAFEAKFSAPLWVPDPALRAAIEDGGYYDNSHLNIAGRALLSEWLSGLVSPLLRADGS